MGRVKEKDIKHWGFYLANVPFWDKGSNSFVHKTRPILLFNFAGNDIIGLPITSNQADDGTEIFNNKPWRVSTKLDKWSLIKVNNPITLDKSALFKYFGIQANTKTRRQVRHAWKRWATPKEI